MELGSIWLGNMAERLRRAGHKVVGFDFSADAVKRLTEAGSVVVNSLQDLVKNLQAPRAHTGDQRDWEAGGRELCQVMPDQDQHAPFAVVR